jgi:hypothetical protein
MKVKRKLRSSLQVVAYGGRSVIATLELFEHHFAKLGHRYLLMTPPYSIHTSAADTRHAKKVGFEEIREPIRNATAVEAPWSWLRDAAPTS